MKSEEYIKGFIDGFMSTGEGYNAEYGSNWGLEWNCPDFDKKEEMVGEIRKSFVEDFE